MSAASTLTNRGKDLGQNVGHMMDKVISMVIECVIFNR